MENGLYLERSDYHKNYDDQGYNIDLWRFFIDNLRSKGIKVPEDYKDIEKFFASEEFNDDFFDSYMRSSIKAILVKMTNLMHKAIVKFEKGMEALDEKSTFVIMDKLTNQIRILSEMYNKSSERKNKNSDSEFNIEKI